MWSLISIEFFIISAIVFGLLGRYIAKQKNRSGAEGFWLGLLFSALGVIIIALLPNKEINSTTDKLDVKPNDENLIPKLDIFFIGMVLLFIFIYLKFLGVL